MRNNTVIHTTVNIYIVHTSITPSICRYCNGHQRQGQTQESFPPPNCHVGSVTRATSLDPAIRQILLLQQWTSIIDCYTVLAWWLLDCQWGTWHMASNWLSSSICDWLICLSHKVFWAYMTSRNLYCFQRHWQSPCTALMAGICLPLGLCKEAVKGSQLHRQPTWLKWVVYCCDDGHYLWNLQCKTFSGQSLDSFR